VACLTYLLMHLLPYFSADTDWQRIQYFSYVADTDTDPWSKSVDWCWPKIWGSANLCRVNPNKKSPANAKGNAQQRCTVVR